jgi:hypothetical protein
MKRLVVATMLLLAIGCGETSTSDAAYILATVPGDPGNPFVIGVTFEPASGHVAIYTIEGRAAGGTFTDLTRLPDFRCDDGYCVDLTSIAPGGGPVDLRVRADPGAFESNVLRYNPGPAIATVTVPSKPDAATNAFLIHFGSQNTAVQVSLQRRLIDGGNNIGDFVTIATGSGTDTLYADGDLAAYTDGAYYEYQAISSAPGSAASKSGVTARTPLKSPSLVSYLPAPEGASVAVRNNSAFPVVITLSTVPSNSTFGLDFATSPQVAPGATASLVYQSPPSFAHFLVTATGGFVANANGVPRSLAADAFGTLQPTTAPLQPTPQTLQAGSSAARDAAGRFCVVEAIISDFSQVGRAVFAPGASAALVLSISSQIKCRFDSSGHAHVVWFQPSADSSSLQGNIMHASNDGTAWHSELIAARGGGFNPPLVGVAFDFGLDGTLFAAWYGSATNIELGTLVSGHPWSVQDIPAPAQPGPLAVSGDETGKPHLLSLNQNLDVHLFQGASGWTAEQITRFQTSNPTIAEMSVAAGVVSFITDQEGNQSQPIFVRGNSSGWNLVNLGLNSLDGIARSPDGHGFIALGNRDNGQTSTIVVVRDGFATKSTVPSAIVSQTAGLVPTAVGFSANGKAWALVWSDVPAITAASPAASVAAFVFDEQ